MRRGLNQLLLSFSILCGIIFGQSSPPCDPGWFGSNCQYKCHCMNDAGCDINGTCPGNTKCAKGWFGPACQYADLAGDVSITVGPIDTYQVLIDDNDTTCYDGTAPNQVTLTWNTPHPFTWLRIQGKDPNALKSVKVTFRTDSSQQVDCTHLQSAQVSEKVIDIHCDMDQLVTQVLLEGDGVKTLCSLYISAGRNVALKQRAHQTSNFDNGYFASYVVDGDSTGPFASTCSHTADNDPAPRWSLQFIQPQIIQRYVLYNRLNGCQDRLNGFIMISFNQNNETVFNYTDNSMGNHNVYTVTSTKRNDSVMYLNINAAKHSSTCNTKEETILALCEVELYGDSSCKSGLFGRECEKTCNCVNNGSCFVSTGGCLGDCAPGYWGEDCWTICPPTRYGSGCQQNCSTNCMNQECHSVTGTCFQCFPGKMGDKCGEDCPLKQYGQNCTGNCSNNYCAGDRCNIIDGTCPNGCQDGYTSKYCNESCPAKTHGMNCTQNCSDTCLVNTTAAPAVCNPKNGVCLLGCVNGKECPLSDKQDTEEMTGLIVGVVIGAVAACVIVGVVATVIFRRRQKSPKHTTQPVAVRNKDQTEPTLLKPKKISSPAFKSDTSTTSALQDTKLNTDKGPVKPSSASPYYNLLSETSKTVIPVKELNTFMSTHDPEYFREQYEKVPGVYEDLSMEVGLSEENSYKNRYRNICAYDHSRVHLNINLEKHEGDYINASYIEGYKNDDKFIASQGPNRIILDDFVRMLWEQKADKVVMLTNLVEEGKSKCEQYWPDDDVSMFGEITVNLATTHVFADYTIRKLTLNVKGKAPHSLTQFHFTSWPDKGVPMAAWALVDFEQRVAAEPTNRPIIVHCSAGVGRTGTFIALHNVIRQAEDKGTMDFYSTLLKLRKDRVYMIQTLEQYIFLHQAAQMAMICRGTTVTASNISDRINFLMKSSESGQTNMEKEYESICHICAEREDPVYEDGSDIGRENVYQNSQTASNKLKNRFNNIVPKDMYRPHLTCNLKNSGDYINAVLVPSFTKSTNQLLTQLPMPETILDFWRLVTQFQVSLVVAFEVDAMTSDSTVENYLPANENEPATCGPFNIATGPKTVTSLFEEQKLVVSANEKWKDISISGATKPEKCNLTHLKCTSTSMDPRILLGLMTKIRSCRSPNDGMTLYMCRNGADYSGVACILSLLLDRMDNDQHLTVPLVVGAIKSIRSQVIPTKDQYKMLYEVLKWYSETSSVYTNIQIGKSAPANKPKASPKPSTTDSDEPSEFDKNV